MSEPTSAYSFEDLIVRVAKEAGIAYYGSSGNAKAMIPVDAHDLDLCKQIVNDGIKMFISDAPIKGWRWMRRIMSVTLTATRITGTVDSATTTTLVDTTLATTYDSDDDLNNYYVYILTGTGAGSYAKITDYDATGTPGECTVAAWLDENGNTGGTTPAAGDTFAITPVETIGGDIARYPLPENFGGEADGEIQYASDTNHVSVINWCHESLIRAQRAVTVNTGYPNRAAIRPFEPVTNVPSAKRRFELIVDPQPVAADTLEFPYTLFFDKLDIEAGTASGGSTTTLVDSAQANLYADDYFNGWTIRIVDGTGKGSYAVVTDYTGASGTFTVADWLTVSGAGDGTDPAADSIYIVTPVVSLHPAGFRFDEAILAACRAKAEMEIEDIAAGWVSKYVQKDKPEAHQIDARSAPRKLGSMDRAKRHVRERTWEDVSYS